MVKIGIKVWICKGEVLTKRDLNPNFVGGKSEVSDRRDRREHDRRDDRRDHDRRDRRDDRRGGGGGGGGGDRRGGGGGRWWRQKIMKKLTSYQLLVAGNIK